MTDPVFYADGCPTDPQAVAQLDGMFDAAIGSLVTFTGNDAYHAVTVTRITPSETLIVSDGCGRGVRLEVTDTSARNSLVGRVIAHCSDSGRRRTTLIQAIPKKERSEQAIDLATQTGVGTIIPWAAHRCIAKWQPGTKAAKAKTKWEHTAREAAKQSRRLSVPVITEQRTSNQLAHAIADHTRRGGIVVLLHEEATRPLANVLASRPELGAPPQTDGLLGGNQLAIVVGPEGGISPEETELFEHNGAICSKLGPEIYRTATAGAAALIAADVILGSW